jgi:hypothetical protein
MARHKSSATKPGERIQAVIKVIFDPETRLFGYYNPETDSSAPFEYPSAHEATDSALSFADDIWGDGKTLDPNVDLTIEGGDWDGHLPDHTRIIAGPSDRRWLNGHLYVLSEDELRERVIDGVARWKAADNAERHAVPIGQAVDAAVKLYKWLYPNRKRLSNQPTQTQFLDTLFSTIEKSSRQRHHSAFLLVASADWPAMDKGYTGSKTGLARIFDAARQFRKPTTQRRPTPLRERYRILSQTVRQGSYAAAQVVVDGFDREDDADTKGAN